MTTAEHREPALTTGAATDADRRVVLPVEEVSVLTGVNVRRLKRHCRDGTIPFERLGNEWLIPRSWVAWIASWPRPGEVPS